MMRKGSNTTIETELCTLHVYKRRALTYTNTRTEGTVRHEEMEERYQLYDETPVSEHVSSVHQEDSEDDEEEGSFSSHTYLPARDALTSDATETEKPASGYCNIHSRYSPNPKNLMLSFMGRDSRSYLNDHLLRKTVKQERRFDFRVENLTQREINHLFHLRGRTAAPPVRAFVRMRDRRPPRTVKRFLRRARQFFVAAEGDDDDDGNDDDDDAARVTRGDDDDGDDDDEHSRTHVIGPGSCFEERCVRGTEEGRRKVRELVAAYDALSTRDAHPPRSYQRRQLLMGATKKKKKKRGSPSPPAPGQTDVRTKAGPRIVMLTATSTTSSCSSSSSSSSSSSGDEKDDKTLAVPASKKSKEKSSKTSQSRHHTSVGEGKASQEGKATSGGEPRAEQDDEQEKEEKILSRSCYSEVRSSPSFSPASHPGGPPGVGAPLEPKVERREYLNVAKERGKEEGGRWKEPTSWRVCRETKEFSCGLGDMFGYHGDYKH